MSLAIAVQRVLASPLTSALLQVDEGDVEVVNIRETDGRLGPLIAVLVALGAVTLFATMAYWWATRPARRVDPPPTIITEPTQGEHLDG